MAASEHEEIHRFHGDRHHRRRRHDDHNEDRAEQVTDNRSPSQTGVSRTLSNPLTEKVFRRGYKLLKQLGKPFSSKKVFPVNIIYFARRTYEGLQAFGLA